MSNFTKDLEQLINKYSEEKLSDTPDFILASYLQSCLDNFNRCINWREKWYGRKKATPNTSVLDEPENTTKFGSL